MSTDHEPAVLVKFASPYCSHLRAGYKHPDTKERVL